jgi:hypothetical protein
MGIYRTIRRRIQARRMRRAFDVLRGMDRAMRRMGWARQRRREFWRRVAKAHGLPEEIIEGLERKVDEAEARG